MDLLSFSVLSRQQETVLWSYSAIPHYCAVLRQSCFGGTLVTEGSNSRYQLWGQWKMSLPLRNGKCHCHVCLTWHAVWVQLVEWENALWEPGQ